MGGRRLHDDWSEVAHAYMGLTVSGYPNFFMLYGPNTNQGGNSIIVILEAQATYVLSALRAMRRHRAKAVDVRRDVMDAYNRSWRRRWTAPCGSDGCQSYFKNANGKIATQLPQTSRWYAEQTKRFQMRGVRTSHEGSRLLRDRSARRLPLRGRARPGRRDRATS